MASGLRLASRLLATQRGSRLILLEALDLKAPRRRKSIPVHGSKIKFGASNNMRRGRDAGNFEPRQRASTMQVLKYNTARRSDAVWGRKAPRLPMAIGIGLQIAHLSRFIGIVGPR